MRIAFAFYGFPRSEPNSEHLLYLKNIVPKNSEIDIYYSVPNIIDEFSKDILDSNFIENFKKVFVGCLCNIIIRSYDPNKYIQKSMSLNLPFKTETRIYPFRILSLIDGISETSKMFDNSMTYVRNQRILTYDAIIITRLDLLHTITSIGSILPISDNLSYVWRTCPYSSLEHVEDRIMVGSNDLIKYLSVLYENIDFIKNLHSSEIFTEKILALYLDGTDLVKKQQIGFNIQYTVQGHEKYSEVLTVFCQNLLDSYKMSTDF